jgi:hypothetical protein
MRSDMFKVLVERPRYGGHGARKGRGPRDVEDYPSKQGMRRPYQNQSGGKSLNEHLGPLRRYLRKQVGRPWNKVYSEICAGLRAGHPVHDHVRAHVFDYVAVDHPRARNNDPNRSAHKDFYVDPRTDLLRINKHRLLRR